MVRRAGHFEATNAEVRINGLIVEPADDSRPTLMIDPTNQTIKGKELTRPWRVSVASSPEIPIYAGPIDWKFSGTGDGPRKVLGFDISGVKKLKGLPVTGYDASFLRSGKATIKPTLRLDVLAVQLLRRRHQLDHVHDRQRQRRRLQRARAEAGQGHRARTGAEGRSAEVAAGRDLGGGRHARAADRQEPRGRCGLRHQERRLRLPEGQHRQPEQADRLGHLPPEHRVRGGRLPASAGRLDRRLGRPVGGGREGGRRRRHPQGDARGPVHRRDRGQREGGGQVQARRGVRPLLVDRPLRVRRQGRLGLLAPEPRRKRRRLGRRPPGVQRRGLAQGVSRRLGPRSVRLREGHPVVEGDRRLRWRLRVLRRSRCHVELRLRRVHRLRPRAVPGGQAGARAGRRRPSRARGSRRGCEAPPGRSRQRAIRRA